MDSIFDKKKNRLGTFCTQWDFIKDRFGENDLLPFSISDMDFESPIAILDALQERLTHGIFGYTRWNHDTYKSSIVKWYTKRFGTQINQDHLVYSPSVCYAIAKIINLKTTNGDHIVFLTPAYDAFFKLIVTNGRVCIESELMSEDGYFKMNFHDLEQKLSHPKAKIFLLCSPHNPTGRVWTSQELNKLLGLCHKYGVFLISDEIHMDILRKDKVHLPILKVASNLKEICLFTSASKTFNTPGLGGAYGIIPDQAMRDEFLLQLKERDHVGGANIFGMTALMAGYSGGEEWLEALNHYLAENLKFVEDFFKQNFPEIHFKTPESTFLAWIDISPLGFTEDDIQHALIHVGKVAFMKGSIYGEAGKNYLRMNVGCSRTKLREGLNGFKTAIAHTRR